MNTVRTIAKNSLWLIIGEIISKVIIFFFTIIVARSIGVVDFGKYSFALSFVMTFSIMIDFGLTIFLFREISRNRSLVAKYVSNILIFRLILCGVFFILVSSLVNILAYPLDTKWLIYLLSGWTIFLNLSWVFRVAFKAIEKMYYEAAINIVDNFLRLALVIFLLKVGVGVIGIGLSLLLASSITLFFSVFIFMRRLCRLNFKIDLSIWSMAFKQVIPLALASMLITCFGRIDNIILSMFKGDMAVGLYNASLKLVWMLIFIPGFITQAAFPKLSTYAFSASEKFGTILAYLLKMNFFLTLPVSLTVSWFSPTIIKFIYGDSYMASFEVLRLLIWTYPLHAVIGALVYALNAKNKQRINAVFIACALLLNILLDLIVVEKFSYMGMVFATLFSLFVLACLLFLYALRRNYLKLNKIIFSWHDLALLRKMSLRHYG